MQCLLDLFWELIADVTNLLTYSMQQSPSWEANRFPASQKNFPAFYGTRRFITAFTSVRHLSLSWANSIQSPQLLPTSWRSILILFSHLRLGLLSGLLPSAFPPKPCIHVYSVPYIILNLTIRRFLFLAAMFKLKDKLCNTQTIK